MSRFASAPWPLKEAYVALMASAVIAGLTGLALVIALAGLHRLSNDLNLLAVPKWFWYFRADPEVQRWLKIGVLSAAGLAMLIAIGVARSIRRPLHGAARWASEAELKREGFRDPTGLLLGRRGGAYLRFGGPEHVLLYAPTRSGKGVGVVIPNLLNWGGSVVVLDVKRENFEVSAGFRLAHGQAVHLFDPLAADGRTARYNPLGHIDRQDPTTALDELQKIALMLFPVPPNTDPFWAEAARVGFLGVGAFVAETQDLPFTLGEIYRQLTRGSPKLRFPAAITDRARQGKPLSPGCVNALTDFCSASDNTFASIKQTITAKMGLWLNPRVDAATAGSDFDLRQIRQRPTSIYLAASPDNMVRVAPLYNLFFQQLIDLNTRRKPDAGDSAELLLLMDEFARLGHASVIAHGFSFVAGYGLRLLAVLQSPAQLRAEYGTDLAEEILANCGVEVAFAPKELKAAQELSERLGHYTYGSQSKSRPTALATGRRTTTESEQRRALMLPQELTQMSRSDLILLRAGIPPIRGRKIVFYASRDFRPRLLAPPEVAVLPGSTEPGRTVDGPGGRLDAIRRTVDDIQTRIVERPMTVAEAAGEDALTPAMVSLALEDVDMDALPQHGASEEQVMAWSAAYLDRATLEEVLDQSGPDLHDRHRHHHDEFEPIQEQP